jgi:hypothetical protein
MADEFERALELCDPVVDRALPLLKFEWNRVRDGEPDYLNAKRTARLALGIGLAASLIVFAICTFLVWHQSA